MFPLKFNNGLTGILEVLNPKKGPNKSFEPLFNTKYEPPSPGAIRQSVEKLSRCSNCCFLIFDNYWSNEIEMIDVRVCPTCGHKI